MSGMGVEERLVLMADTMAGLPMTERPGVIQQRVFPAELSPIDFCHQ
jgi:hypothetical protein